MQALANRGGEKSPLYSFNQNFTEMELQINPREILALLNRLVFSEREFEKRLLDDYKNIARVFAISGSEFAEAVIDAAKKNIENKKSLEKFIEEVDYFLVGRLKRK